MSAASESRFAAEDVETWERDGVTLLKGLFTSEECAAVRADFDIVFGRSGSATPLSKKGEGEVGKLHPA